LAGCAGETRRLIVGLVPRHQAVPEFETTAQGSRVATSVAEARGGLDAEEHQVETAFGQQSFGRKEGEALHAEREPAEMLEQIRRTRGEYN
jgi:hypothetical protein